MRLAISLCMVTALAVEARQSQRPRPPDAFRLLPGGGGVSTHSSNICDVFSSELTGSWLCLNGDGTARSGSQALSAVGSPTGQTKSLCPNGPNCANVVARRTNGTTQHYKTSDVLPPTGDLSMVWVGTIDTVGAVQMFVAHDSDTPANNRGAAMLVLSGGEVRMDIFKTDAASTAIQSTAVVTQRATHTVIATYDFVTDGTSVGKVYLDGVEVATSSTVVGPVQAGAGTYWSVGERELSTGRAFLGGSTISAMMTEKVLAPATVTAMSEYATGKLSGSFGETITFARTSASACQNHAETELSILPAGRSCVTRGGIRIEPAATNLLLRSEEIDNAAWLSSVTPVVVANVATSSPDGSKTMDSIQDDTALAVEGKFQSVVTTSSTYYTFSCYAAPTTPAGSAHMIITGTGSSLGDTTCVLEDISTAMVRRACTTVAAYGATLASIRVDFNIGTGAGDAAAEQTWNVWGCQLEAGNTTESHATSYIRTAGASVTRSAETNTFVNTLTNSDSSWCIAGLINNVLSANVNTRGIVGIGTFAANNTALLRLEDTTRYPQAIVFDNAGGQKIITYQVAQSAGVSHLRFCNSGGTLTLFHNGASVGGVSGAGTGIITTMPGTISTGINGATGPFEDAVSDACVGRGALSCALGR